jgi:hypothetical protein
MTEKEFTFSIEEKRIPESKRTPKLRNPVYDKIVEAISRKPIGTTGEIKFSGKSFNTVYSALLARKKEVADTTPFLLTLRDVERDSKTRKVLKGKLYFKRVSAEEYQRTKQRRKK